jgi:hypothetical protein
MLNLISQYFLWSIFIVENRVCPFSFDVIFYSFLQKCTCYESRPDIELFKQDFWILFSFPREFHVSTLTWVIVASLQVLAYLVTLHDRVSILSNAT